MSLKFEDDFPYVSGNSGAPDPSKWTYQIGNGQGGWGNGELEYYTSSTQNSFISPGGGTLNIAAINQPSNGFNYTSARLNSLQSWVYGHFETKAQVPNGLGTWPAIWMMPESSQYGAWPNSGELDIVETVGFGVHTMHATAHGLSLAGQPSPADGVSTTLSAPTDDTAFHVYAMDWTPQKISWTMDGAPYPGSYSKPAGAGWQEWPFDQPFYYLMNVAVGGSWGGQQGVNASAFAAPGQILQIQYMRVCQ
jgi:beta-glucanase (GH16 family)